MIPAGPRARRIPHCSASHALARVYRMSFVSSIGRPRPQCRHGAALLDHAAHAETRIDAKALYQSNGSNCSESCTTRDLRTLNTFPSSKVLPLAGRRIRAAYAPEVFSRQQTRSATSMTLDGYRWIAVAFDKQMWALRRGGRFGFLT